MPATVTVRAKAFGDERIVYLAQLLGCSWNDALVRMIRLWSVCAEQQTDTPEVRRIRASLEHTQGEQHLVESGLGDDLRRDPSLASGVVRVRGCDETDWYYAQLERAGQVQAGKARAAGAARDRAGRFAQEIGPPESSGGPASDLSPDLISGSADLIRPELPEDLGAIVGAERERAVAALMPKPLAPLRSTQDLRRKLHTDAWTYAGLKHEELKREGIDPTARNCWAGLACGDPAKELFARIDELTVPYLQTGTPARDAFASAGEIIRNRVDVAAAESRREPRSLRWFTPARMWDGKSFGIAKDLTPAQASQPRITKPPNEAPVRRIPTAE